MGMTEKQGGSDLRQVQTVATNNNDGTWSITGIDVHTLNDGTLTYSVTETDTAGNTSAASIPLAFDTAVKDGRIRKGELVLFEAMGGGFTWGAVLARY